MKAMYQTIRIGFVCLGLAQIAACSTTSNTTAVGYDRYETVNRQIYAFNDALDKKILRPTALGYQSLLPEPVRHSVGNIFQNLYEPFSFVNHLLQAKPASAADSAGRFILNSTFGLAGIFDVATPMGLAAIEPEDFGQTFGRWGLPSGPYLMLPFFGPSTVRDTGSLLIEWALDPLGSMDDLPRYSAKALNLLDKRTNLLGTDATLEMQLDPYIFLRESYLQNREKNVLDGQVEEEIDEFEEDLFK